MHISRVDLNLFVVFDAIYAEGSITAAARRLNLSQPAVSHALGRLRNLLGDPLLAREGRRMVPTPYARAIIDQVRAALGQLEGTLTEQAGFDPGASTRSFNLALRDLLEQIVVPPLMEHLCLNARGIQIVCGRMDRRTLEDDLLTGRIDLALDVLLPVSAAIRRVRVLAEPLMVLGRQDHPALRDGLDLDGYLAAEHVQVSSRRRGPGVEDMELARVGVTRRIRLRCQHNGTACRTVARTNLLATMPARYAAAINEPYGNRIVPMPLPDARLELYLYWHANADADPAAIWLREQVQALMAGA